MRKLILPVVILLLIGGGAFFLFGSGAIGGLGQGAAPTPPPAAAAAPIGVTADGKVLPAADVTLAFERAGTVVEILVAEGDSVQAGQPLARLDARALELKLAQAQVNVEKARARYNQVAAGASPETIAAAEAAVSQARAGETQAAAGVSPQDLAAAQAQVAEARAALAQLLDGPKGTEVTQAQAGLDQAQANLSAQRDALSAIKTNLELEIQQAANVLRDRQADYNDIYWDNRELEDQLDKFGKDLPQERIDLEEAALRAVENAEVHLQQLQVSFEQARQAEIEGVASAEARVREAQAKLDQLLAAPDSDRVAAARAKVAAAEASLAKLRGPLRSSQLEVAAASVAQAQAQRDQVAAGPREVDLAVARVEVEAAEVAVEQARYDLDQATLLAPFAGTVAQVNLDVGALAGPEKPAFVLADLSSWQVETEDLTELDVVRLRPGDAVAVTFDALPELTLPGHVLRIKPIGGSRQGDVVYTVVVSLDESDPRLLWNMTAVVSKEG